MADRERIESLIPRVIALAESLRALSLEDDIKKQIERMQVLRG
jgi:hypothetical protein